MIDLATLQRIDPNAIPRSVKKGEVLQRAGDTKTVTYWVQQGLLRSYILDSKGKEHIYMFAPEGWIMGDVEAMEYEQPVELYIDCLEDSVVIPFDNECLFKADLSKAQIVENAKLLYRRIGRLQRRILMQMGSPALDRYTYFLKTYPELPHRVPQHMIATYLGMAPQTLSTIRKKMAHSH